MNCPVCKTVQLKDDRLDTGMFVATCGDCGGHWLSQANYWRWREVQRDTPAELPADAAARLQVADHTRAKLCPECGRFLVRHKVGHGLAFSIDHCSACGGAWFDRNELEALRSVNLHDDIHFIFTETWQAGVQSEEREKAYHQFLLAKFGEKDLAELKRIKAWIDSHPKSREVWAFLEGKGDGAK